MCVFLRRFCLNKCDDLAVKLACQGGTHFGSFSRIMFYLSSLFRLEHSRWLQCYLVSARCPHPFCLYNFIAPNGVWSRSCENAYDCMSRGSRTRENTRNESSRKSRSCENTHDCKSRGVICTSRRSRARENTRNERSRKSRCSENTHDCKSRGVIWNLTRIFSVAQKMLNVASLNVDAD